MFKNQKNRQEPVLLILFGSLWTALDDVDDFLHHCSSSEAGLALGTERNFSISDRIKSVVFADFHILSCLYFCTALTDNNRTWLCRGAVRKLDSEIFRVRII